MKPGSTKTAQEAADSMMKTTIASFITLFILSSFFVLSCSDEPHNNTGGRSKGSVELALNWNTNTENATDEGAIERASELVLNDDGTINCTASEAESIFVTIYDQVNDEILSDNGAGWNCIDHVGVIEEVPAGNSRKIVCFAEDANGNVIYRGQKSDITVLGGANGNNSVQITLTPFTSVPTVYEDGAAVNTDTLNFECGTVQGASSYQLQMYTDINLESIVADQTSDINRFNPITVATSGIYYWRVRSIDYHGLEGAWSTPYTLNVTTPGPNPDQADFTKDENCVGAWHMNADTGAETDISGAGSFLLDLNSTTHTSSIVPSGYSGTSRNFNGAEGFLYHNEGSSTDISGLAISFGAWIQPESTTGDMMIIGKGKTYGDYQQYYLYYRKDSNAVIFGLSSDGTTSSRAISATDLSDGVWTHVFAVYDGTDMRIYINGVLDSNGGHNPKTFSSAIADQSSTFRIGGQGSTMYWDGLIDEPIMFDRALSATEVLSIYNHGISGGQGKGNE